jgi:hypothetical protein
VFCRNHEKLVVSHSKQGSMCDPVAPLKIAIFDRLWDNPLGWGCQYAFGGQHD